MKKIILLIWKLLLLPLMGVALALRIVAYSIFTLYLWLTFDKESARQILRKTFCAPYKKPIKFVSKIVK